MADLGDIAEHGLDTYAYTKQQELAAKNPGYRDYVERQQKLGLYIFGGLLVVGVGAYLLTKNKKSTSTTSTFSHEKNIYDSIFKKGMNSSNKQAVENLAQCFEKRGCNFFARALYNKAKSL